MKNRLIILCCVGALLWAQMPTAHAGVEPSAEAITADLLVVRPLCLAATVIGSALFLVALPIAAVSKSTRSTARGLVVTPARATFTRDLGDFDDF